MGYMLETRGLTKRFGRGDQAQDAVADVSLHIREGEVYGLLGPNGAGKSTTLKMICGMLRPTAGEILFAGHAWRREDLYAIGSLIEEAPLYPNLTARENLRVRTTLLGLPESRVDEVLAAVDLADTGKKRAGRFSMGMRQRLGLALALIARPRLLVLDEPTPPAPRATEAATTGSASTPPPRPRAPTGAPSRSPTAPRAARWPPSRSPCEGLTTQALTPACLAIKRFPDNNARCKDRPG